MQSANEVLRHYTCTSTYYQYHFGMLLTDGVKALATEFQCFWLLDIIASYQPTLDDAAFQVWKLEVHQDGSGLVTCTDGNITVLKRQVIPFIDFAATEVIVWVENDVILLPSEH